MVYISNIAKATSDKKIIEITVHHGDTLWSIAHEIAPQSDPRAIIKKIKNRNQINNSDLIAGQKLEVEIADNI
jgi:LysM repeat protein